MNRHENIDVVVNDTVSFGDGVKRRMIIETPVAVMQLDGSFDRGVDHVEEARKIFHFLQECMSEVTYDALTRMMYYDDMSEGGDDVYTAMISEAERTLFALEYVNERNFCGTVETVVENELALLERKIAELRLLRDDVDEL